MCAQIIAEPPFYAKYLGNVKGYLSLPASVQKKFLQWPPEVYESFRKLLTSPNTKRVIFDARQALIFDKTEPIQEGFKVKPFFDQFYLEFSSPIKIQGQEPGYEDELCAIIYVHDFGRIPVLTSEKDTEIKHASMVCFLFQCKDGESYVERVFRIDCDTFEPYPAVLNCKDTADPSEFPKEVGKNNWLTPGFVFESMPNRKIGWWESNIEHWTQLLVWIFAYTMAKSVKISPLPSLISRQQRRQMERKGYIPQPWHQITVEPKLTKPKVEFVGESDREVGYRFDVISHLRFAKHKMADGSWKYNIELVSAHQRGLKHEIYIPKTYKVEKKKIIKEMGQYFNKSTMKAIE